ncbi:transposase [Pirellulimonas nuda]|nr:transposase [Pirellulimonas nuda]
MIGLHHSAAQAMKGDPVRLSRAQAQVVVLQLRETASYRGWALLAVAVMANHFHVVMSASNDSDPQKILNDLKAYTSRALNRKFGKPASARWWTSGGSKRRLFNNAAIGGAIHYVRFKQFNPLIVWPPLEEPQL